MSTGNSPARLGLAIGFDRVDGTGEADAEDGEGKGMADRNGDGDGDGGNETPGPTPHAAIRSAAASTSVRL